MAAKRQIEEDASDVKSKKPRTGFKVGPDNLPDGTWRRKVIKIKHDLVHKAKVKKQYAKIKKREGLTDDPPISTTGEKQDSQPEVSQELHPERQAMLDAPPTVLEDENPNPFPGSRSRDRRKNQRPAYFDKEVKIAEKKKQESEYRRLEAERRDKERKLKLEERERFRKNMAKARTGGKNGQRKLGRESTVLLEKVKRMIGE